MAGKPGRAKTAAKNMMNEQPAYFSMLHFVKISSMIGQFIPVLQYLPDSSKEGKENTKTQYPGNRKDPVRC